MLPETFPIKRIPKTPEKPLAFILYVLRHCPSHMKLRAGIGIACEAVGTVADVLVTWVLGRIVGVILMAGDNVWHAALPQLFLLAVIWTVRNISYRSREYCERRYVPQLLNLTRSLLFNRLVQQSQAFLHSNFAGVLANHIRRASDVLGSLREKVQFNIVPLAVRFVTAGFLLWQITPMFALFILAFVVLCGIGAVFSAPYWKEFSRIQAEKSSQLSGYIIDSATNLSVVQQNVGWPEEQRRLDFAHGEIIDTYIKRYTFGSYFWGIFDLVMTIFFCGFVVLLIYGWQHGNVTSAQLAMTVGLSVNLFASLANTVNLLSSKFDDIGVLQEALQKISTPMSVVDAPDAPHLQVQAGAVEFREVGFIYPHSPPLFERLNLSIPAGQKVGLVGVSGSGKTTLCQLLLRAYDVTQGGIYIDGTNIADVTQDSLHAQISVIPQEPVLFHRSIADNIRYGKLDASREEVVLAAQSAAAEEFIVRLPKNYDTLVGERGVKLSGGQRQRVAMARAIIKHAPILVLDEATSALDSETERTIQQAMLHVMEGHTTLVVAHRLSTLSRMDRIVVMDKGRIVEDGGFAELRKANGPFARLWRLQSGGFLPDHLPGDAQ